MKSFKLIVLLVVALVLMFGPVVVEAQDGGQSGQEEPLVVETSTDWSALFILISALSGVLAGGGTVFVIMGRANHSVQLKDSTEKLLADAVPAETVRLIHNLAEGAQQTTGFLLKQFSFPGVPEAIANTIKAGVQVAGQAADFVEAVTDGEANIAPAG